MLGLNVGGREEEEAAKWGFDGDGIFECEKGEMMLEVGQSADSEVQVKHEKTNIDIKTRNVDLKK